MIHYFLEVSLCWIILISVYFFFLRKETFFKSNRWYLIHSLWLGMLLPLLKQIPYQFTTDNVVYSNTIEYINYSTLTIAQSIESPTSQALFWSWQSILVSVYLIGLVLALTRMILGLYKIYKLYKSAKKLTKGTYFLVVTDKYHLPFSFFNYVFINEKFLEKPYIRTILDHELIHIKHKHTYDIFFLQIISALFWWNPIIYLFKKAIKETHEYLADAYASVDSDIKNYGQILLGQSSSGIELALTNQFFNSFLKQRINMLQQKKSATYKKSKYLLAIPFLAFMVILFTSSTFNENIDEHYHEIVESPTSHSTKIVDHMSNESIETETPIKKPNTARNHIAVVDNGVFEIEKKTQFPTTNYLDKVEIKTNDSNPSESIVSEKDVIETLVELPSDIVKSISGKVLDFETQQPLIGATVIIENSKTGAISGIDGNFGLNTKENDSHIIVSYIGYESERIAISNEYDFTVYLKKSMEEMEIELSNNPPIAPPPPPFPPAATLDIKDLSDDKYTFILNGNSADYQDVKKLKAENIKSINIFKPNNDNKQNSKDVVEIFTTDVIEVEVEQNTNLKETEITFVINGEVIDKEEIDKIDPNKIKQINVHKGDRAEAIYGKVHRGGVVEVELKEDEKLKLKNKKQSSKTKIKQKLPKGEPIKVKIITNPIVNGTVEFELQSTQVNRVDINIYSVDGSIVKSTTLKPNQNPSFSSVDLKGLIAGTYYIRFTQGEESITKKFIIAQ